ncbi:MAG: transposase, partial [Planctomycetaceae bacterium]
ILRDLVATLISQARNTTRCTNQLHKHLARVFPELSLIANNISEKWVLTMLEQYPTPARLAAARSTTLCRIPHLAPDRAAAIQAMARSTTGSLAGPLAENLVIQAVKALRASLEREAECLNWIETALRQLPAGGHQHLISIPGIGPRTAAVLIAKIATIERFQTAAHLVSYFGICPELNTSGVDKSGTPITRGQQRMSTRGCDFVRQMLWMAVLSAIRANPPIKTLYERQIAAGKSPSVALGHCMRKLLHQVFAIWKTNQPFDKCFQSRQRPTSPARIASVVIDQPALGDSVPSRVPEQRSDESKQKAAAGRKGVGPQKKAVTATATLLRTRKLPTQPALCNSIPSSTGDGRSRRSKSAGLVDYADLRRRVSITQVLVKLGRIELLTGTGDQRRGPCPVHDPSGTQPGARHFSVHLKRNLFRCLHPKCQAHGNALDLWAAVKQLTL